jgi:hypothetical protein
LIVIVAAGGLPCAARAETVVVENENYTDSHDLLYAVIQTESAPSCHGGAMLVGLDAYDEWVEYDLSVSALGSWTVSMVCRGDLNIGYSFQVRATGKSSGASQVITMYYSGMGYG